MGPAPRARLLALALAFLLAGCAQANHAADGPASGTATHPATASANPAATATLAPAAPSAPAKPASPFPTEVKLSGCLNPRMLFFLEPAQAQALLPPGYKAADATGLLRYVGFPQPPAVATGKAVAGYDFLTCAASSLDGTPQSFSEVGVFIDPPHVETDNASAVPTNLDLYLLALNTPSAPLRGLLSKAGFAPTEALDVHMRSQQSTPPLFDGTGSVAADTALASAEWDGAGNGNPLSVHGRYWHTSAAGTFYFDFRLDETVNAGAITSCTQTEGSPYAKVAGTTSCGSEARFAAVGTNSTIAGGLHFLPGVVPA